MLIYFGVINEIRIDCFSLLEVSPQTSPQLSVSETKRGLSERRLVEMEHSVVVRQVVDNVNWLFERRLGVDAGERSCFIDNKLLNPSKPMSPHSNCLPPFQIFALG